MAVFSVDYNETFLPGNIKSDLFVSCNNSKDSNKKDRCYQSSSNHRRTTRKDHTVSNNIGNNESSNLRFMNEKSDVATALKEQQHRDKHHYHHIPAKANGSNGKTHHMISHNKTAVSNGNSLPSFKVAHPKGDQANGKRKSIHSSSSSETSRSTKGQPSPALVDNKTSSTTAAQSRLLRDSLTSSRSGQARQRPRDCPQPSPLSRSSEVKRQVLPDSRKTSARIVNNCPTVQRIVSKPEDAKCTISSSKPTKAAPGPTFLGQSVTVSCKGGATRVNKNQKQPEYCPAKNVGPNNGSSAVKMNGSVIGGQYVVNIRITSDSEDEEPRRRTAEKVALPQPFQHASIQCGAAFSSFRNKGSQAPENYRMEVDRHIVTPPSPGINVTMPKLQQQPPLNNNSKVSSWAIREVPPVIIRINDVDIAEHLDTPTSTMSASGTCSSSTTLSSRRSSGDGPVSPNSNIDREEQINETVYNQMTSHQRIDQLKQFEEQLNIETTNSNLETSLSDKDEAEALQSCEIIKTASPPSLRPVSTSNSLSTTMWTESSSLTSPSTRKSGRNRRDYAVPPQNNNKTVSNNERLKSRLEQLRNKCSEIESVLRTRAAEFETRRERRSHSLGDSRFNSDPQLAARTKYLSSELAEERLGKCLVKSPSLSVVSERETALTVGEKTPPPTTSSPVSSIAEIPASLPPGYSETPNGAATTQQSEQRSVSIAEDDTVQQESNFATAENASDDPLGTPLSIEIPRSRGNSIAETEPQLYLPENRLEHALQAELPKLSKTVQQQSSELPQLLIPASEVQKLPGIAAVRQRERSNFYMGVMGAPPPSSQPPGIFAASSSSTQQTTIGLSSVINPRQPVSSTRFVQDTSRRASASLTNRRPTPADLVEEIRQRRRGEMLNVDRLSLKEPSSFSARDCRTTSSVFRSGSTKMPYNTTTGSTDQYDNTFINKSSNFLHEMVANDIIADRSQHHRQTTYESDQIRQYSTKDNKEQGLETLSRATSSFDEQTADEKVEERNGKKHDSSGYLFDNEADDSKQNNVPVGTLIEADHEAAFSFGANNKVENSTATVRRLASVEEDDDGYFSRRKEVTTSGPGTFFSKLYFTTQPTLSVSALHPTDGAATSKTVTNGAVGDKWDDNYRNHQRDSPVEGEQQRYTYQLSRQNRLEGELRPVSDEQNSLSPSPSPSQFSPKERPW